MDQVLYKYCSLEPWDYFMDILIKRHLHAATFQSLRDPMEGMLTYSQDKVSPSFLAQIRENEVKFRICSLSKVHDNTVMWSQYAAAHTGVVVGVTVDDRDAHVMGVQNVTYSNENIFRGFLGSNVSSAARRVLSKKLTAWQYEQEVRVFTEANFVPVRLHSLYLGCRMDKQKNELIKHMMGKMFPNLPVCEMTVDELDSDLVGEII